MKSIVWKSLLLPVFAAALIFCVSSRALGQRERIIPDSVPPCIKLAGMSITGTYQEGEEDSSSIYVEDTTNWVFNAVSIIKLSGDTGIVQVEAPPTPLRLNPGEVLSLPIHFNMQCPPTKDVYSGTFEILCEGSTQCTSTLVTFSFQVLSPITSYLIELDIPSFDTLVANQQLSQNIYARNTTSDTIQITQILLIDDPRPGVQWSFENRPNLPLRLGPGDVLTLDSLSAVAEDSNPITGSLLIGYTYPCGTDTETIPLNGKIKQASPAGVSNDSEQQTGFTLNPNPSHGDVTISLPRGNNSTVEVYDVLGNLVLRRQASGEFVWNPETPNGTAANGTYIIRVTERGADGRFAVSSQRLLFVR